MLHGKIQPMPAQFSANGYWMALYQTDSVGTTLTYSMWPTTANTIKGFNSTGAPTAYTPAQIAAILSTFFDAAGMAAAVLATAQTYAAGQAATAQASAIAAAATATDVKISALVGSAPSLLSTLAAIDAQIASDETAAAALLATVGGKFAQPTGTTAQYVTGNGTLATFASSALAAVTWSTITGKPTFSSVSTSGSYNDLSNQPTIPAAQVNSDWTASSGTSQILNKPTLGTAAAMAATDFDSAGTAAAQIADLRSTAPSTLDTLAEIDAQLASDENAAAMLVTAVAGKMPLADRRLAVVPFTQNLCAVAQNSGHFQITGISSLAGYSKIRAWQSDVPVIGTLADFLEMDQIAISASIVNNTTLNFFWVASGPVIGPFNFNYQIAA